MVDVQLFMHVTDYAINRSRIIGGFPFFSNQLGAASKKVVLLDGA